MPTSPKYCFIHGSRTDDANTNRPPHPNASENIHIFEVTFNPITGKYYCKNGQCSCCNMRKTKGILEVPALDEKKVRSEAANLQNQGKNICANCVRTFYKDED